jgi:UDP-N-acetylglucosamine diphosphorylase / glucose-1-phosphate thymidylyltransferase / UDP-N-acetylgalactosamine diphosphorylase / glucosamine-1-phosphate N-acetyltransferase / galactosamine-1-phosphate N-acetyltransferase
MANTPILIILAGGASSRMWPLREKSLIKFMQAPLLLMQLRRYESLGFSDAVLVGNPHNIDDLRTIGAQSALSIDYAIQDQPIGMGDAVLRAAAKIQDRRDDAIYITQVHDVTDIRLHEDMLAMYRSNPDGTYMAGVKMDDYFPGGYLIVNDSGHISGIVEKPGADKRPSQYVNIVAHIHANGGALFDQIQQQYDAGISSDDHYERAMDALMKDKPFYLVGYDGRWDALKYPWHVLSIMERFLGEIDGQTISPEAYVSEQAAIVGDVIIEAGAKVFPGAGIVGPAYIGKDTIVGNGALVRHAMVLNNCQVGFTTEVARSYVADGVNLHACRVLDSIFAENVNFSAGCTTANLRIDKGIVPTTVKGQRMASGRDKFGSVIGAGAFLGVDVMTMPGTKIGADAVVGPGTHVHDDVPDGARLYVKQAQVLVTAEEQDEA